MQGVGGGRDEGRESSRTIGGGKEEREKKATSQREQGGREAYLLVIRQTVSERVRARSELVHISWDRIS